MSMPGFSAQASLYKTSNHYVTTGHGSSGEVVPQLALGLTDDQLYICRLACAYCRYVGWYCWTCWYCAIIIVLGGERA
jgi:hypothetical protein